MKALGTRGGETLQHRIKDRLDDELERRIRAGEIRIADRGVGIFDAAGADGDCYLTLDDVARIAAAEATAWF